MAVILLNPEQHETLRELEDEFPTKTWRVIGTHLDLPVVSDGSQMFCLTVKRSKATKDRKHPGRFRVLFGNQIVKQEN